MTDINSTTIQGRLTRDPELKYSAKGTPILSFSIATNKSIKKGEQWEDETSFFDIVQFGKMAEYTKQKISKGAGVLVSGELKQERWEKDGQQRSRVTVVAQSVLPILREQTAQHPTPQVAKPADDFDDDINF